jgi:MYXO-CTERM domain-containing protein
VLDEPEPSVAGAAGATGTPIAGIPDDAGTSGCGCRVAARRSNGSMVFFVALLIGGAAVRRRFRRTPPVSVRSVLAAGILTLTGTSGCGGRSVSSSDSDAGNGGGGIADAGGPTAAAGAACVPALGASTVAHACSHTDNGPYVAIAALASSAPDISELHKTFSVLVVDAGAALMYRPKRHGDHVVLTDRAVTIDVVKQGTVEGLQGDPFPVEGCRSIVQAIRAELAAGEKYQLRVREPSQSEFKLFVEYPPAFGAKAWKSCAP